MMRRFYALAWSVALLLLVLLALYASLGRQYIGLVSRYQTEIFDELQAIAKIELAASELTGSWSGLSPVLRLGSLDIAGGAIQLDGLRVELDPIGSLLGVGPRLKQLQVKHLQLSLRQDDSGRWRLPGIAGGRGGSLDSLLDVILAVRRASVGSFKLRLQFADGRESEVRSRDFSWSSDGHFRRSYARLSADDSGEIRFIAEAFGDPRDYNFRVSAYVSLDSSRFSVLAPLFRNQRLMHSQVDGELWLDWQAGRRMSVRGELRADELAAGALWGSDEQFSDVVMRFLGRHYDGFWRIGFSEFSAQWRGQSLNLAGLSLEHPRPSLWEFALPELELAASAELIKGSGVAGESLQAVLDTLSPAGRLRHLRVSVARGESLAFSIRSELDGVSLSPWQGAPGVSGLSGYLHVENTSGRLLIDSEQLQLDFPNLYAEPFALSELRTELRWQLDDERLRLMSSPILARDQRAPLHALLRLDLPVLEGAERPPEMTLAIAAERLPLASAMSYVPKVLDQGLRDWLSNSLRAGRAEQAAFLYRGSLRDGDSAGRSVQLSLELSDFALLFDSQWPQLVAPHASAYLDDAELWASAESGHFSNLEIRDVQVSIEDRGGPQLDVKALASGKAAAVQSLFRDSPLAELTGNVLSDWQLSGRVDSQFALQMPLSDGGRPAVQVSSQLQLSRLTLPGLNLSLTELRGPLNYSSEKGVSSANLTARFFGEPLRASLSQDRGAVRMDASTVVDMADVQRWLAQPALGFVQGRARVDMSLRAGGEDAGVVVRSNMLGVDVRLPQPLYKAADEPRELTIHQPFGDQQNILSIAFGELLRLQYQAEVGEGAPALSLTLGDGPLTPLRSGALTVSGALEFAAVDQWQRALSRYLEWQSLQPAINTGAGLAVMVERLRIGELETLGRIQHDASISARSDERAWTLRIDSRELAGNIEVPLQTGDPYVLMFERLELPALEGAGSADSVLAEQDPRGFPALDVDIEALTIAGKHYGRLGFDLRPDTQGAHFLALRGQLLGVDLGDARRNNALHWWYQDNGRRGSQLKGKFAVRDLGAVMVALGYDRALETRSGQFDINLSWLGSPDQWVMSGSQGRVKFALKNGRFFKTSDAASGALRVLGIFNMTNIVRRLKFDFRDVFRKGVHFDNMVGELGFSGQRLSLTEPLEVSGPSSRFQMSGNIDLLSEALDLRLVATLPVGSNLPWMAALIGGLPAAAGAYVVTKVFEEQVDSFSSAVYDIHGTVQQPELSFRKIFDASQPEIKPAGERLGDKP